MQMEGDPVSRDGDGLAANEGDTREREGEEEGKGEIDIDSCLEARAVQYNLSVQNVKSIIRHVLKDERFIAIGQQIADGDRDINIDILKPPARLTRSKVRQAVASSYVGSTDAIEATGTSCVSLSPAVPHSTTAGGGTDKDGTGGGPVLSCSSDDEEYTPGNDSNYIETEDTMTETDVDDDTIIEMDDGGRGGDDDVSHETGDIHTTPVPDTPAPLASDGNTLRALPKMVLPLTSNTNCKDTDPTSNNPLCSAVPVADDKPTTLPESVAATADDDDDKDKQIIHEAAMLLASLSDVSFTPLKSQQEQPEEEEGGNEIAKRTRSKLMLVDKDINDIEASFVPPDVQSDEDTATLDVARHVDVDEDDLEWQRWLADLINPNDISYDDWDNDTEYNFMSEDFQYEKEEFRTDRAVKIPQREVDELLEELLNPTSGVFSSTDPVTIPSSAPSFDNANVDLTGAYLLETLGLRLPVLQTSVIRQTQDEKVENVETLASSSSSSGALYLSHDQTLQVWDQLQQHFQLLMQTFLLTRFEPTLVFMSQIVSQAIEEIAGWCKQADYGKKKGTIWYIPGLNESCELILQYNPFDANVATHHISNTIIPHVGPPKLPDVVQDIIFNYGIFWQYPQYIPDNAMYPLEGSSVKHKFTTEEDCLLVLGMKHYGLTAWKIIQEKLLPTKTPKQLHIHVKNHSSARVKGDNVIKHFKRTGEILVDSSSNKDLPQWVMQYHLKRLKDEETKREQRERQQKIFRELSSVISSGSGSGKGSSGLHSVGVKRNLSSDMVIMETKAKRCRRDNKGKDRQLLSSSSESSLIKSHPTADYQQLLYMAGLERSEPAARYAYNYLIEVKAVVCDVPGVYQKFLDALLMAKRQGWSPGELYVKLKIILSDWPHLLKLYMEFMNMNSEGLPAATIADKISFNQIKAFVDKLEAKYKDSPLELEDVLSRLRELSSSQAINRTEILSQLKGVLSAHNDLVEDIMYLINERLPLHDHDINSSRDDYEVTSLPYDINQHLDIYEDVEMPAGTSHDMSRDPNIAVSSKTLDPLPTTSNNSRQQWSRVEDKSILSLYDKTDHSKSQQLARQLNRTVEEVNERYEYLIQTYQSMVNNTTTI